MEISKANTSLVEKYVIPSKIQTEASVTIVEEPPPKFPTRSLFHKHILLSAAQRGIKLIILAISRNPNEYFQTLQEKTIFHIIDCFTDPIGWMKDDGRKTSTPNTTTFSSFEDIISLQKCITPHLASETPVLLFVDSLHQLFFKHGVTSVLRMLRSLTRSNSKNIRTIASIQTNCCLELDLKKLRYSCETNIKLHTPSSKSSSVTVEVIRKHANGKLTRSVEHYNATKTGILEYIGSQKVQESEFQVSSKKKVDPTANLTFNLKLTEEEKSAKESVVLPYTHHLHQKEDDGTVDTDEEEEEFEDPDDDLDI